MTRLSRICAQHWIAAIPYGAAGCRVGRSQRAARDTNSDEHCLQLVVQQIRKHECRKGSKPWQSFRSAKIHRIVVGEWPRVYDNLKLDSEKHYNAQRSGGGTIPPYTGRYYL